MISLNTLATQLARANNLTSAESKELIKSLFDIIKENVENSEKVNIN